MKSLVISLAIVSLELVHSIPLTRHRKPGSSNFSWVSDLDAVDQGKVNKNLHLFNDITYKDRRKVTASMLSVQMSTEVIPPKKKEEVPETLVVPKKKAENSVKVLGFNIYLKKTRHECWKDGMKDFCSNNHLEYFNELTLPPNYNSHVFLSSLHEKKIIALKDGLSLLASEKAKKSGNTTKKDPYDDPYEDPYGRSDIVKLIVMKKMMMTIIAHRICFLVLPIQFLMGKMFVSSWRILSRRTICGILDVRHRVFV